MQNEETYLGHLLFQQVRKLMVTIEAERYLQMFLEHQSFQWTEVEEEMNLVVQAQADQEIEEDLEAEEKQEELLVDIILNMVE